MLATTLVTPLRDEDDVRAALSEASCCERLVWHFSPGETEWARAEANSPGTAQLRRHFLGLVRDYDALRNADRKGPWFPVSVSGRRFWPLDPRPEDFAIGDVAWALSAIPRFNGHGKIFVSVAQHSVLVSEKVSPENALLGLLHDAPEAFLNDVMTPVKALLGKAYGRLESLAWLAIAAAFDVKESPEGWRDVKEADRRALVSEHRSLFPGGYLPLETPSRPYDDPIESWSPEHARERFLERFRELNG